MYKLIVKDSQDEWLTVDLGDDKPAMNFEANNIGDLKNRRATYSQKLTLPLTDNNCRIFGMVHLFDILSDIPYRTHECRLYYSDTEIAGKGSILTIVTMHERTMDTQILSGITDLFDLLKNTKLEENTELFPVRASSYASPNYNSFIEIALATFKTGGVTAFNPKMGNTLPFVKYIAAIDYILAKYGYTMECNKREELSNVAIPVVTPSPMLEDFSQWNPSVTTTIDYNPGNMSGEQVNFQFGDIQYDANGTMYFQGGKKSLLAYKAPVNTKIDFDFIVERNTFKEDTFYQVELQLKKNGVGVPSYDTIGVTPRMIGRDYDLLSTDEIVFEIKTYDTWDYQTNGAITFYCNITIKPDTNQQPFILSTIPVFSSLGLSTELDFFKGFIQSFGMFVDVDVKNRVLKCNTFEVVIDNKYPVLDWTQKLDIKEIEWDFHNNDYAQRNLLLLQDNDKDLVTDSGIFEIEDMVLQREKEFLKLPFEAGLDKNFSLGAMTVTPVANIPLIKEEFEEQEDEEGNISYVSKISIAATKPHLCRLSGIYIYNFIGVTSQYQSARHIPISELLNYYNSFIDIFNKYKKLTVKMALTVQDIEEFNQLKPVYLEQFGSFFYVNKIRNFVANRLTEVELIKI
ncbi:MAG: hypothetical protein LBS50_11240 [Prevotellaceae bacterium]|jgi:hypothetical protein|nr:hypothetical protein [Prevotellaceae bacterium]